MIEGPFKFIPKRTGEAKETLACIDSAIKYLGWSPQIKLKDWIKETKK